MHRPIYGIGLCIPFMRHCIGLSEAYGRLCLDLSIDLEVGYAYTSTNCRPIRTYRRATPRSIIGLW